MMKEQTDTKTRNMNKPLHITASFDQPQLLENLVEQLAYRRTETGTVNKEIMPAGWEADKTSSVEAYVSGNVEFDFNEDYLIRMPFITCFMFTCTKGMNDPYKMNWSSSFS